MNDRDILQLLEWTGHLEWPFGRQQEEAAEAVRNCSTISLLNPAVEKAIASYQDFMVEILDPLTLYHHSRPCRCDGVIGPATRVLMGQPRCGCCDYGPNVQPAVGTGSWPRCHSIGDFHAATVHVNESGMASWLKPVFGEVWDLNVGAYEELGLRWIRTDSLSANIEFSFVRSSRGWIGLAIVGQGQSCGSQIWCKYLSTWKPSNVVREWAVLVMHELGHNAGLQHTRGGVMNPGIIYGLPASWKGDPAEPILNRYYGGEPIEPVPPPPPEPPAPPPPGGEMYGVQEWFRTGEKGKVVSLGHYDVIRRAEVP